jgi:hypothetical protein
MDKKMITTIIAVFFAIVVGVIGVTYAVAPSNDSVAYDDSDDYDDDDYYEDDEDDYYDDDYDDDYDYDEDDDYDYSNSGNSGYSSNTSGSSITHYCQASGCYKEGTKTVTGISGSTEYYCQEHYNEMQNTINSMEQDVGNGTASRHTCEECSREGTHTLNGISGRTEYYCTEHYNQIMDMLEEMSGD